MTAQDKDRILLELQRRQNLQGTGIIVCEGGPFPQVVRWPQGPGRKSYITLWKLDAVNRAWLEPIWQRNVQLQLWKAGASRTEIVFACAVAGQYACFLSVAQKELGGSNQAWLDKATKEMQETQMSFNLQYLQLQSSMQNENRQFTAVSNIMKTKHDTVKNSISNIR
jgi:hypothetical protein